MYLLMYNDIYIYTYIHIYTQIQNIYIYIIQISTKKTLHVLLSHLQHFPRPPLHPPMALQRPGHAARQAPRNGPSTAGDDADDVDDAGAGTGTGAGAGEADACGWAGCGDR